MRFPDVRLVGREDVFEVTLALDALRRELRDVELAGPFVLVLDQEPAASVTAAPASAGAHEDPRAFQLVTVQRELQVPLLQRRVDILGLGRHVPWSHSMTIPAP